MRLLSFSGNGIRGFQSNNINFRDSVTFLIGINGSGKTTVLNLMQGLLLPSYRLLDLIEYHFIELKLSVDSDQKTVVISSKKDDKTLTISYQVNGNTFDSSIDRYIGKTGSDYMFTEEYVHHCNMFSQMYVCQEISKLHTPQLISLERRPSAIFDDSFQRTMFSRRSEPISHNIDDCLRMIQESIFNFCRINIKKQDQIAKEYRNSVVKTSLRFNSDVFPTQIPFDKVSEEQSKLERREADFLETISGLGMDEVKTEIQNYFQMLKQSLSDMVSSIEKERSKATVVWLFNNAQLSKVDEIIAYGHEYQRKIEKMTESIRRFEDSVNLFFKECNKVLKISKDGIIKVLFYASGEDRPTKVGKVFELSSGEKQIVALFGSLIFLNQKNTDVFLVDEPEISLHLSWQDIFVDALLQACPDYQFILATHSPNIIAQSYRNEWCEDLSPKLF